MSAKKQIRLYCRWCTMNFPPEIIKCPTFDCPLWKFRTGDSIKGESKQKAIKKRCEDCMQSTKTVFCKETTCELYAYRTGKRPENPNIPKRVLSPELIEKMQKNRIIKRKQKNA